MRVVVVDPAGFTPHYDANLCHALAARGHEMKLETSAFLFEQVPNLGGYEVRESFFRGLNARSVFTSWQPARRALKAAVYPFQMSRWAHSLGRRLPDIVHVEWSLVPLWDERILRRIQRRGARVVLTIHDVEPLPDTGGTRVGNSRLYRLPDAVIVHSEYSRRRLVEDFALPEHDVHVVPLGGPGEFASKPLAQDLARDELGLPRDAVCVLFFGLIKKHKGLDLLFEALALVSRDRPALRLLVAGRPMQAWSSYEHQIERLGIADAVDLHLQFIPTELMPRYFAAADLVALPYRESFQSGVAVAAYTFERPVLATTVGGLPELVTEGETGFLARPNDVEDLARALSKATADPERLSSMRTAAGRRAGDHAWDRIAARHEEIYAGTLAAQQRKVRAR